MLKEEDTVKELETKVIYKDLSRTLAEPLLKSAKYPWEIFDSIAKFIREVAKSLPSDEYDLIGEDIYVSKSAKIAPTAYIGSPAIICAGAEIRNCAFIRQSAIVGKNAVVGNSTELKNCILFDGAAVPHFNYVGDSILGFKAHMGAGAVTSNVKSDKSPVTISMGGEKISTGRKKFGAILGDFVEVGCGSVLNPGTVIGTGSSIYPLSSVRGYVPQDSIYKNRGEIANKIKA